MVKKTYNLTRKYEFDQMISDLNGIIMNDMDDSATITSLYGEIITVKYFKNISMFVLGSIAVNASKVEYYSFGLGYLGQVLRLYSENGDGVGSIYVDKKSKNV